MKKHITIRLTREELATIICDHLEEKLIHEGHLSEPTPEGLVWIEFDKKCIDWDGCIVRLYPDGTNDDDDDDDDDEPDNNDDPNSSKIMTSSELEEAFNLSTTEGLQ